MAENNDKSDGKSLHQKNINGYFSTDTLIKELNGICNELYNVHCCNVFYRYAQEAITNPKDPLDDRNEWRNGLIHTGMWLANLEIECIDQLEKIKQKMIKNDAQLS